MGRLLTLKQALATLEEFETGLKLADSDEDSEDDDLDDLFLDDDEDTLERLGLDKDELKLLLMDAEYAAPQQPPKKKRKTSTKASKPETTADASTKQPIFDLVEPEFTASSKSSSTHIDLDVEMADAYGEASSLQHADAADKKARKKSLRFHTSKIESASAKRQGARSQAVGGDDDIPYRERRKEKEARLAKEAAAKVRGQGGADLDDTTPEAKIGTQKDDYDGSSDEDVEDGYYELVKNKAKAKKEQKKAEYEAAQAAARYVFFH
jgi:U3 small nucleolar RNA-associated protein 3